MTKKTFNNEGVQLLLADIYQLSIVDYSDEIRFIRSDFSVWLKNRFTLSVKQSIYLSELDSEYLYLLSQEVSTAIENQSPIELRQEKKDDDDDDGEGKVIETNHVSQSSFNLDDGLQSTSNLIIHIRYEQD